MASQFELPKEGHLGEVFHIHVYLKQKYDSCLVLDPSCTVTDESAFKKCNWKDFYSDVSEEIPEDPPQERGEEVDLRMHVDNAHAGDKLTRRSRKDVMI